MPDLVDAAGDPGGTEVDHDAERLEDVGRARRRRRGAAPVLAHPGPAPATTRAAMVDTLIEQTAVPAGPAGVDHSSGRGTGSGSAWSSMARTRPVISSMVSPLIRRAVTNAAICAGVAAPESTSPSASAASSALRSCRATEPPEHRRPPA